MNKKQVKTKDDLELYYTKCRKIKVKGDYTPECLVDLINLIIKERPCTTYVRGGHHCHKYKYRSLDDVIKLCKYYFPDTTVSNILNTITKMAINKTCIFAYCDDIKKSNFRFVSYAGNYEFAQTSSTFEEQGFRNCNVAIAEFFE